MVSGFRLLGPLLLNVRFKDKALLFHLISLFENDCGPASLTKILAELDGFNERNPLPEMA